MMDQFTNKKRIIKHRKNIISLHKHIIYRDLRICDIDHIISEFAINKVYKSKSLMKYYLKEQVEQKRKIWVAFIQNNFVGYITLTRSSRYKPFNDSGTPEIIDFFVLPHYRNIGIGSRLLNMAEKEAILFSDYIGLGVGLDVDFGKAQQLYFYKGYIPDGRGITYNNEKIKIGNTIKFDENFLLWLIKKLK